MFFFFFFFQAEDGIRDGHVTGVQTCALPISRSVTLFLQGSRSPGALFPAAISAGNLQEASWPRKPLRKARLWCSVSTRRSEERRVGKECGARGGRWL